MDKKNEITLNKADKAKKADPFKVGPFRLYGLGLKVVNRKWERSEFADSRIVISVLKGEESSSGRINRSLDVFASAFKGCKTEALLGFDELTNFNAEATEAGRVRAYELLVKWSDKVRSLPILPAEAEAIEEGLRKYETFKAWREAVKGTAKAKATPAERFNALAKALGEDFGPLALAWVKAHSVEDKEAEKAKAKALAEASRDERVKKLSEALKATEAEAEKAKAEATEERAKIAKVFAEKAKLETKTREALEAKAKAEAERDRAILKVASLEERIAKAKAKAKR